MTLGIEYIYKNLKYLDFSFTNPSYQSIIYRAMAEFTE